jgi:hypothetical protein
MKDKFKKIFRILKKVLLVLLGLMLIFLLGTTIWNKVVCIQEDKALSHVGTNVNVNGTNIRVSVKAPKKGMFFKKSFLVCKLIHLNLCIFEEFVNLQ